MKRFQILILFLLSIRLIAQNQKAKFQFSDALLPVDSLLEKKFGSKKMNQIRKRSSLKVSILELQNSLKGTESPHNNSLLGICECHLMDGKLEIVNSVGFMSGIANVIEINISDQSYESKLHYRTDGIKMHKFNPNEEFIQNIVLPFKQSRLEISPDSKFTHLGIIKGRLTGETLVYYEQNDNEKGYKKLQKKVISTFECQLQDMNTLLLEIEKKNRN